MIAKLDSRGRLAIGAAVRKNGVEPADYWEIVYGPYQTLILKPVVMTIRSDQEVKWEPTT